LRRERPDAYPFQSQSLPAAEYSTSKPMLAAISILLVYQLIGEIITLTFSLPVPGPVIGMALLFVTLSLRRRIPGQLQNTSQTLLRHLSLLFIPAGTGVMLHTQRLANEWLPIVASLLISTVLGLLVTAAVMSALARFARKQ
jgi:holin-like protein